LIKKRNHITRIEPLTRKYLPFTFQCEKKKRKDKPYEKFNAGGKFIKKLLLLEKEQIS